MHHAITFDCHLRFSFSFYYNRLYRIPASGLRYAILDMQGAFSVGETVSWRRATSRSDGLRVDVYEQVHSILLSRTKNSFSIREVLLRSSGLGTVLAAGKRDLRAAGRNCGAPRKAAEPLQINRILGLNIMSTAWLLACGFPPRFLGSRLRACCPASSYGLRRVICTPTLLIVFVPVTAETNRPNSDPGPIRVSKMLCTNMKCGVHRVRTRCRTRLYGVQWDWRGHNVASARGLQQGLTAPSRIPLNGDLAELMH